MVYILEKAFGAPPHRRLFVTAVGTYRSSRRDESFPQSNQDLFFSNTVQRQWKIGRGCKDGVYRKWGFGTVMHTKRLPKGMYLGTVH